MYRNLFTSQMHVLFVLSFIIERVGNGIKPHVGALSSYLPELWQQSEVYNMLRCAIVSTLIHLEKVNIRFIVSNRGLIIFS